MQKRNFFLVTLCLIFSLAPYSIHAEETAKTNLPPTPDTGSPEEDFAAGGTRGPSPDTVSAEEDFAAEGTRENHLLTQLCGVNEPQIAYLLGDKNREFTLSAYPTFWFYLSENTNQINQLKFTLKEVGTDKQIYQNVVKIPRNSGTIGMTIPRQEKYALSSNVNYSWSLELDCKDNNNESIILEGWLNRIPLNAELQQQLATASVDNKYQVYLQHNLLYDALNDLAQRRFQNPYNSQIVNSWNQLLTELGWQDLAQQSTIKHYIVNSNITYADTK